MRVRYLRLDEEREEELDEALPAEPVLKPPEERLEELGLKLLRDEPEDLLLPELKLPEELLPELKLLLPDLLLPDE